MGSTLNGVITVKNGKVAHLKNVTDLNVAYVCQGDLHSVLQTLAKPGWTLQGDYELVISRMVEESENA
jgi:hypothetical protein